MTSKIDVSKIFWDHLSTLKNQGEKQWSVYDILTFYVVPFFASLLHLAFGGAIDPKNILDIDGILVSAFSIFAALLLNVQVLIIGLRERFQKASPLHLKQNATAEQPETNPALKQEPSRLSPEDEVLANRLEAREVSPLQELFANVSYAILVAILLVACTLIAIFLNIAGDKIVVAVQFFGILHFTLTSIMILKRMHVVFLKWG